MPNDPNWTEREVGLPAPANGTPTKPKYHWKLHSLAPNNPNISGGHQLKGHTSAVQTVPVEVHPVKPEKQPQQPGQCF